jgi:hypothetical protein
MCNAQNNIFIKIVSNISKDILYSVMMSYALADNPKVFLILTLSSHSRQYPLHLSYLYLSTVCNK